MRELLKISKTITVTVCADNLDENTNPDHDSFYANKQTVARLMKIAREENVKVEEPINLNEVSTSKEQDVISKKREI